MPVKESLLATLGRVSRTYADQMTTPVPAATFLQLFDPVRYSNRTLGRVIDRTRNDARTATLTIRTGPSWQPHVPGQYVRVGVDITGRRQWRPYSLTSRPGDPHLSITVRAQQDGIVSPYLVHEARRGTILHLSEPDGDFSLPDPLPQRVLFITGGNGLTPVLGMLRSHPDLTDVVVVHQERDPTEVIAARELQAMAHRRHHRVHLHLSGQDGRLTIDRLRQLVPDMERRLTWACGPAGMMSLLREEWQRCSIVDRLHVEQFHTDLTSVESSEGSVTFSRTELTAPCGERETLLQTGESAGVAMKSGCRMGICRSCVVRLDRGQVRDLRNGHNSHAEAGDQIYIQPCVTTAIGACEIWA